MTIVWTGRAVGQLAAIADSINAHNPHAALAVRDRIRSAIERLGESPLSGRPGRVAETRELVVPGAPYIVAYRARNEQVEILAILHAARDWPDAV